MIKPWHPLDSAKPVAAKEPTPVQVAQRRRYALTLCEGAQNAASWRMADRMARVWLDCGCAELGVRMPDERLTG